MVNSLQGLPLVRQKRPFVCHALRVFANTLGLRRTDHWQCSRANKSILEQVVDLLMEQQTLLSPVEDMLTSTLEIFEDNEKYGFLPTLGFHFFWFSKAHNSETS